MTVNIKETIGRSSSNNKRFGYYYMSFSTHSVRWLIEKILLFVLILIAMLLLFDHSNWVMEWSITGVVRQLLVMVSASFC